MPEIPRNTRNNLIPLLFATYRFFGVFGTQRISSFGTTGQWSIGSVFRIVLVRLGTFSIVLKAPASLITVRNSANIRQCSCPSGFDECEDNCLHFHECRTQHDDVFSPMNSSTGFFGGHGSTHVPSLCFTVSRRFCTVRLVPKIDLIHWSSEYRL